MTYVLNNIIIKEQLTSNSGVNTVTSIQNVSSYRLVEKTVEFIVTRWGCSSGIEAYLSVANWLPSVL